MVASLAACRSKPQSRDAAQPAPAAARAQAASPEDDSPQTATPSPVPNIDKLDLHGLPTVVNLDDDPGSDGVQVRLFLFRLQEPLAVALRQGRVEFVMIEGRISAAELADAEPRRVWSFSAAELERFTSKSAVGACYTLPLAWGDERPRRDTVTITARLLRPNARPLYAQPLYLAAGPK